MLRPVSLARTEQIRMFMGQSATDRRSKVVQRLQHVWQIASSAELHVELRPNGYNPGNPARVQQSIKPNRQIVN